MRSTEKRGRAPGREGHYADRANAHPQMAYPKEEPSPAGGALMKIWRFTLVLACLVVLTRYDIASRAPLAATEDELIGLWFYGTAFGQMLRGEVTLERKGGRWRATCEGLEATAAVNGDDVRLVFPRGKGQFRGAVAANGRTVEGFWLRPGVREDPRFPDGASQPFATPIALHYSGPEKWSGKIHPLEDHFNLYLKVFRDERGTLLGAFRDPSLNRIGGASRLRVTLQGAAIEFSLRNETGEFEAAGAATVLREPLRLKMRWSDLGREIELHRCTPEETAGFFPRPPGAPAYVYRQPEAKDDDWKTARGRAVDIDEDALVRLVRKISESDPAAPRPSLIHSVLVARHGRLVLEEYFFGHDRETPHDLRSAGKTFASVMLGAAMMNGVDISPETRVYDLLKALGPFANPDPRKAKITLAHLMTHTAGLAVNDNDDASPGNEGVMQKQTAEPDWWKYTLDLPLTHEPGTRYAYGSANMNLAGAALTAATGIWLPELFDRTVAHPLGFDPYHWNLMPSDEGYLGGGAFLRPRDLLKVGQAYLDGGVWRGRRIVKESWVALSTAPWVDVTPETTGLSPEDFGEFYAGGKDGYTWHRYGIRVGDRVVEEYEANGNGGQMLIVVPDFDLVVVFTGGNYRQGGIWGRWRDEIIGGEILPAITR